MHQMQGKTRMLEAVFGPINSRRFGKSLGIDLSPSLKQCNFDCLYCELEGKRAQNHVQTLITPQEILTQIQSKLTPDLDVITITANGEPTLYPHLYELIVQLKALLPKNLKTLILSNGSRFGDAQVQKALLLFDMVKFSLDGGNHKIFSRIDRPHQDLNFSHITQGILEFSKIYQGILIAEVLLIKNINDQEENLLELIKLFRQINPKRIDLSTIDRPPAYKATALDLDSLQKIAHFFETMLPHSIITVPLRNDNIKKINIKHQQDLFELIQRRPLEIGEANKMLDAHALHLLHLLLKEQKIFIQKNHDLTFYTTKKTSQI